MNIVPRIQWLTENFNLEFKFPFTNLMTNITFPQSFSACLTLKYKVTFISGHAPRADSAGYGLYSTVSTGLLTSVTASTNLDIKNPKSCLNLLTHIFVNFSNKWWLDHFFKKPVCISNLWGAGMRGLRHKLFRKLLVAYQKELQRLALSKQTQRGKEKNWGCARNQVFSRTQALEIAVMFCTELWGSREARLPDFKKNSQE